MSLRLVVFIFWGFVSSLSAVRAATITINVLDSAGVGFNDTTAATPVGGNTGTTIGAQRLNAFQHVADNIGAYLESSVPIVIDARFAGLSCTANSGTLGSAGSNGAFRDFTNAPKSNTFYPSALANALAGSDLDTSNNDISASFNGDVGSTGCLENLNWYYGFDHNEPSNGIDFIATLTHELLHGLGFSSFASVTDGTFLGVSNSSNVGIFDRFIFDSEQKKTWAEMTDAERVAAAINDPNLAWNGDNVTAASLYLTGGTSDINIVTVNSGPTTLQGTFVRLYAPNPVEVGSSVSHFTTTATPNLLMEPVINSDLFSSQIDLSQQLLKDLGWPFQASSLSDISVTLTSSAEQVLLGTNFDYLITVSNNAQADATLIKTQLVLPTGVSYQSSSGTGWTCIPPTTSPTIVNCDLSTVIANGQNSTLTVTTTAPTTGTGLVTSTVTAATITTEFNATNNTASKSVTFAGNNIPVASNASFSTTEDVALSGIVSASDADSGDSLTFSLVNNATKGSVTFSNTATGAFTYTPTAGQVGSDSFTFKVNDGIADSNTATVSITINSVNATQTVTSPSGGQISVTTTEAGSSVTALTVLGDSDPLISSQAATMPTETTFPHGFIAYKIEGVPTGATVNIDIVFPSIPDNPKLYKVDAADGFVEFTAFSISGNTVTVTLVDGGIGDADGVANGVIDDPLGLASASTTTVVGNTLTGGGGGGSFDLVLLLTLLLLYSVKRYFQVQQR